MFKMTSRFVNSWSHVTKIKGENSWTSNCQGKFYCSQSNLAWMKKSFQKLIINIGQFQTPFCGHPKMITSSTYTFPVELRNIPIGQSFGTAVPNGQYFPLGQMFPVTPSLGVAELEFSVQ